MFSLFWTAPNFHFHFLSLSFIQITQEEWRDELGLESFEDLNHEVTDGPDDLVVVVVECHLHVKTDKLRQVTVSVGVFRTEH